MALFKISMGLKENLPATKTDGYCWFTTDDQKFYIDYPVIGQGNTATTVRSPLNSYNSDYLNGKCTLHNVEATDGSGTLDLSIINFENNLEGERYRVFTDFNNDHFPSLKSLTTQQKFGTLPVTADVVDIIDYQSGSASLPAWLDNGIFKPINKLELPYFTIDEWLKPASTYDPANGSIVLNNPNGANNTYPSFVTTGGIKVAKQSQFGTYNSLPGVVIEENGAMTLNYNDLVGKALTVNGKTDLNGDVNFQSKVTTYGDLTIKGGAKSVSAEDETVYVPIKAGTPVEVEDLVPLGYLNNHLSNLKEQEYFYSPPNIYRDTKEVTSSNAQNNFIWFLFRITDRTLIYYNGLLLAENHHYRRFVDSQGRYQSRIELIDWTSQPGDIIEAVIFEEPLLVPQ